MKHIYCTVIEVSGLPETTSFWMSTDPYVKMTVGGKSAKTSIKKRAGGRAIFHESFNLPLDGTDCTIEILDNCTFGSDSLLAHGTVTVKPRDGYSYMGPISLQDNKGTGLSPEIVVAISVHEQ